MNYYMGTQLHAMGRCLETNVVQSGFYVVYFPISIINAMEGMLPTRLILSFA